MALAVYMGYLVYGQYRSQEELHRASLNRFILESENRATAASYFLADRFADQQRLRESPELSLYYENRALGMSLEYGLGAAILAVQEGLGRQRQQLRFEQKEIYHRLVFVTAQGDTLADVHPAGLFAGEENRDWRGFLAPSSRHTVILRDSRDSSGDYLLFSSPSLFKGRYAGQLLAWLPIEFLYRTFVSPPAPDSIFLPTLLLNDHYVKVPRDTRLRIEPASLPDPRKLPSNTIFSAQVNSPQGGHETVSGILTPIAGAPMAIAIFLPEELGGGHGPKRLIIVLASLAMLSMAGAAAMLRITMRNALLQARLEETAVRERIVAEKNANLRKLTTAIDQSANAVVIANGRGTVEYVNPAFTAMTGYQAEEILGRHLARSWGGGKHDAALRDMWRAIKRGELWSGELLSARKDGEQFWERLTTSPVKDEHGTVCNYIVIKEDFTSRRHAEDAIRALNVSLEQRVQERTAALEQSNRELAQAYSELKQAQSRIFQQEKMASIGQLAAGVAHEINNPMGFIISNFNSLKKYLDRVVEFIRIQTAALGGLPQAEQAAATVREERKRLKVDYILEDIDHLIAESADGSQRVRKIVQSLKSFSHVDEAEYKEADINEGLESSLAIAWNEIKYKATVTRDYGELQRTVCNIGQLNQVFMNLLVNAAGAIDAQGEITVRTRVEGENILVAISDTGCGIPPENLPRIFEPFFTTKEVGKGTGLGLSIVYDIVKKHNGRIEVKSEVGKGTTFTVLLPVVREPPVDA